MFEQNRLRPHFVRGITREKLPVGRVYKVPGPKPKKGYESAEEEQPPDKFLAEIEEAFVVRVYDPEDDKERDIVIDPRHEQSRDQIKLVQDLLEGRVGGLTPFRMEVETAVALDPTGNAIPGTQITRVAEMETPALTRGQAKVVVDGHPIGEWTPELDAEVDRSCSFEVARRFSDFMLNLADDPKAASWEEVSALGKTHFARHLKSTGNDQATVDRELARYSVLREDFLRGIHVDLTGLETVQSVWDPLRSPVPITAGEQSQYFIQRALIERFQETMQKVAKVNEKGETQFTDAILANESKLLELKALPAGKPQRNPIITEYICNEKSRQIATHLLGGYLKAQGATVKDAQLAEELDAEWRLHADVMSTLAAAKVPPADMPKMYFHATEARSLAYGDESRRKVEAKARACLKFPTTEHHGPDGDDSLHKRAAALGEKALSLSEEAGNAMEGISFGL